MSRLWEYQSRSKRRQIRRGAFTREAQASGFQSQIRDSLISRGMDPDIIDLAAPPVTTKPVDRGLIREVVPEPNVGSTQRDLAPRETLSPEAKGEQRNLAFINRMVQRYFPGKESEIA